MEKKNTKLMRTGAVLAVLALGTSCFAGGTLAKYVTSGAGSDSARVAKFGVQVTANGSAFAKTYATDDASFTLSANSVVSSNEDDLVAPGTKGNMASMTLTGTPEVAVRVSYDVTDLELTNWTTDGTDEYCPIEFNVNGTTYKIDGTAITNVADLQAKVTEAIKGYSKDYEANTDLSTVGGDSLAISWAWPFSTSDANDVKDTALGDRAAADPANAGKIDLEIRTTVTQID